MDFFDVLSLFGGLALFLFGMQSMGDGLAKLSGGRMEKVLEKLTARRVKAVLLGAGVTAVIQSSSATTVMVVGFVNSGIMKLSQAVGIIFGANIGTTITSWILSLSGISGDNFWVQLLKPSSFSPVLALIGIVLLLFSKKERKKDIGNILVSFAVLMTGMELMSGAVAPLKNNAAFTELFTMFSNPVFGLLAGALLTAVIQSSSASVGILQALCSTGAIGYSSALPIILGQNIGTCVTALLSSIGTQKNARRAALVHLYFNVIGTIVFMALFYGLNAFFHFRFLEQQANEFGIAVAHTAFNVFATVLLLPFANGLEKLACLTIRDKEEPQGNEKLSEGSGQKDPAPLRLLDVRFLEKPAFAVEQCRKTAVNMAKVAKASLLFSLELLEQYDAKKAEQVVQLEDLVDQYEDELGDYLVKVSAKSLNEADSKIVSKLLHCIGDLERISDHALNIKEAADEMQKKQVRFSAEAREELRVLERAVGNILERAVNCFIREDKTLAFTVEPLEEVIDGINTELKRRHVNRLVNGQCTIELGFILSDVTNNLERVADHCSNLAVCELRTEAAGFDSHDYLGKMRSEDEEFKKLYQSFLEEYTLAKAQN